MQHRKNELELYVLIIYLEIISYAENVLKGRKSRIVSKVYANNFSISLYEKLTSGKGA